LSIEREGRGLRIRWPDGLAHSFHPLWLRERSFDPANRDPLTGQRLEEAVFLPLDVSIRSFSGGVETGVELEFSDGHRCAFDASDLRRAVEHPLPDDLVGAKRLWDASLDPLPRHAFDDTAGDSGLLALLDDLARYGLVLVEGLPGELDALKSLTDRIGPIRVTNWGGIADVKSIANAYDLTMTGRALEPHCDNPYRLPGPGYIFLHCIENSAEGGDSLVVDGFHVAERLCAEDPEAFRTLCETPVTFRYEDGDAILEHYGPLIEVHPDGRVHRVRFNNRTDQVVATTIRELDRYYAARRAFADLVWSPEMMLRFRLGAGQGYIVDNYRLLHGRTEVRLATGNRHLRQCYMDRDIVASRQKTLRRATG